MKVSVAFGERRLVVDVPDAPGEPASVDGKPEPADLVEVQPGRYSLLIGGRSHEVVLEGSGFASDPSGVSGEEFIAHIGGLILELRVEDERRRTLAALEGRRHGKVGEASSATLTAPMPGRVVAVLEAPGTAVERGQSLVVLEAMKMESVLSAPHAGIVAEVLITPGQTVQQRQPLVRVERRE